MVDIQLRYFQILYFLLEAQLTVSIGFVNGLVIVTDATATLMFQYISVFVFWIYPS